MELVVSPRVWKWYSCRGFVLDGQLPLDEGDAFIVMNGTDASGQ